MTAHPPTDLIDALDAPSESLRLVAQCRDALIAEGNVWGEFFGHRVRAKIEDRSFHGVVWSGPGFEAVALAGWDMAGDLGRRGWMYLAEGYRTRTMLEGFLQRLESPTVGVLPFLSWADEVPGVPESDRSAVFGSRGLFPVVRADMRYPKTAAPAHTPEDPGYPVRSLTFTDASRIADLLYRVYEKSPERALFATTLDQREDARRAVHDLLHGGIGRWLPDASFAIERNGQLIAETLANELEGGLITEVGVDPSYRRRGLARRLLPHTIDALRSAGFAVPRLVVTMWNPGAVRLYQSVGFEFVPGGAGRVWLNLPALGIERPLAPLG